MICDMRSVLHLRNFHSKLARSSEFPTRLLLLAKHFSFMLRVLRTETNVEFGA